jgi:predicted RecB family nuclease
LGTDLHAAAAHCLAHGLPPLLDTPLLEHLRAALTLARQIIAGRPSLLETKLRPLPGLPQVWGTADICAFDRQHRLGAIVDYKFGIYPVPADSLQLAVYALLAGRMFGISPAGVTAWIVQPRAEHPAGSARGAHYTAAQLAAVEQVIRQAATRARLPNQPRVAGSWCTFCRAADDCETRRQAEPPRVKSNFFIR